jgi:hypothetical protein
MTQNRNKRYLHLALMLLPACAAGPDGAPDELQDPTTATQRVAASEASLRIPTAFRAECAALASLPAPPDDLTIGGFLGCLTDASRSSLAAAYARRAVRRAGAGPADLDAFVAAYGTRRVSEGRLSDLAFARAPRNVQLGGVEPRVAASASTASYGLDPTTCSSSCLSTWVNVVNGRRRIGYSPAWTGADPAPFGWFRLLDEVNPGTFPDHNQDNLSDPELQAAGCGPVSAVNLLEWWGIPVYKGSTQLTSFDDRAEYIAVKMNTLDGINFTDDEDLIDFVTQYPAQLYAAGRISGYPGWHYMIDEPEAWQVMLSYVARGYPVIVLYASGSISMHWAVITGYTGGKLRIANAGDRTLADFYAQWHDWQALSWYASWAADLYVDPDTFVAYTGWGSGGRPEPPRFAARTAGYSSGGDVYAFRYCAGAPDEIGLDAEDVPVSFWPDEPAPAPPGTCMFLTPSAGFTLKPSPSGGSATSASGATIALSVESTSALASFIAANPGVRCRFYGESTSGWERLADRRCSDDGALRYTLTNTGSYSKIEFQVHSPELARTTWSIGMR